MVSITQTNGKYSEMAVSSKGVKSSEPKKSRGKPFSGGDDPRRHTNGTKSSAAISFARELRSIIVEVGEEEISNEKGEKKTRLELAVRGMYLKASKGDASAFNALIERVEGKVSQPVKHELSNLSDAELIARTASLFTGIAALLGGTGAANTGESREP